MEEISEDIVLPTDVTKLPRYCGEGTFARAPRAQDVRTWDVGVVGVPFDAGVSYRSGARFGPMGVRQASRTIRPQYHPDFGFSPFRQLQVVDAGDLVGTPYDINAAVHEIEDGALSLLGANRRLIAIGGDHTIALPMLRAVHKKFGRVAMIHFDAHLDTWDQYFGMKITHGTMFRRAYEEDIFLPDHCIHVGTRGPIYSANDLSEDANMGFKVIRSSDFDDRGFNELVTEARTRLGSAPTYISVDIDVLDPAFAPGTGTPEAGGLISRELLRFLRALRGVDVVGADVVEVAPAYDHSEVTSIQAATVVFDLIALMACSKQQHARVSGEPGC